VKRFLDKSTVFALALSLLAPPGQAAPVTWADGATSSDLAESLRGASLLEALPEGATPQDILASAQADYNRLLSTFYDAGYFGATISIMLDGREAASIPPVSAPNAISSVVIRVDQGPQFRFGTAEIKPLAGGTELPDGFATGAPAGTGVLRTAVTAGVDQWREIGHAKALPAGQRITANHPAQTLNASVTLDPGPRLTFGELIVDADSTVRPERILEIAGLPSGEVFSPDEVSRVATRLRRTGTFRSVALTEANEIGADNTLDILAEIADQTPRRFGFGGEISSLEGLSLSAFWLHRNWLGGAERLRIEGEIGGIGGDSGGTDYRLSARFDRPATFNEDTDFYALAEVERLDEVSFELDQARVEVGIRRYASEKREYTLGLGLQTAKTTDVFGTREYTIFTLPLGATFDYRDDRLDATSGYYASLSATPFLGFDGSDSGLRTYADLRAFYTVGEGRPLTFAARAQIGSVTGASQDRAPTDFLFYSGGGGTVRGQSYQSLAVDLGGGNMVGGRAFIGLSGEVRFKATDSIGLVGFVDAGYVGSEAFPDGSSGEWHSGAGLGLRYATGIGPIRVDVAVPVSGPEPDSDFQVYIGIGQSF
jgi:translocation and assembly module TamA